MLRMLMFLAVGAALLSAFGLYAISYQAKQISDANQAAESRIKKLSQDIAILRAERSFLTRPERIEPLARKLGMQPVRGDQFISRSRLTSQVKRR